LGSREEGAKETAGKVRNCDNSNYDKRQYEAVWVDTIVGLKTTWPFFG